MVLPTFVRHALAGKPILVHGDGRQTRSFTWVGDVVSGLIALADEPKSAGEVFNIGNGAEISILDLAWKVKHMIGSESPIRLIPYDQVFDSGFEDMPRRVPDIGKIRGFIGYRPTVQLDEIIARDRILDRRRRSSRLRRMSTRARDIATTTAVASAQRSHEDSCRLSPPGRVCLK
jgi:UDP-glucose 4-epimerase